MMTIKESIELLLRILRSFGFSRLKAETLRLAKFDDGSSARPLWRLLFEALYYCRYGALDEVCARAFAQFSGSEIVKYVRRELAGHGYASRELARLDGEMAAGSRELLLAFGWLLCKEALIDQFCAASVQPLLGAGAGAGEGEGEGTPPAPAPGPVPAEALRQMVWLNGRMRMHLRQLGALRREGAGLEAGAAGGLGEGEAFLVRHPDLLARNLQLLEKDADRLQALLRWRAHEDEFWQWMESVLDLKLQEPAPEAEAPSDASGSSAAEEDGRRLAAAARALETAVAKYEGIAEQLERQWARRSLSVSRAEVERVIRAVDADIRAFSAAVGPRRLRADLLPRPSPGSVREGLERLLPDTASTVEREVDRLEAVLAQLEADVESNYAAFNDQLQTVSRFTRSMVLQA